MIPCALVPLAGPPPQELRESWAARPKGTRVNMCRFMGAITVARERLSQWHLRSLECMYYGVATGKLENQRYNAIWGGKGIGDALGSKGDDEEPQTTRRDDSGLRKLRQVCDNTLMLAALFYSGEENLMRQAVLCGVARIAQEWQGMHNERCRSVNSAFEVSLDWCGGAFLESCGASLHSLAKPDLLVAMKFEITFCANDLAGLEVNHPRVVQANEFAQLGGSLAIRLVAHRLRKFLDVVCGWPRRFVLLASPLAEVWSATMAALKKDVDIFEGVMGQQPYPEVKAMCKRSLFSLPAVHQFVELARAEGFICLERVQRFAKKVNSRIIQTQISEDGFNRLRTEEDKGRTKKVCDERCWKGTGFSSDGLRALSSACDSEGVARR